MSGGSLDYVYSHVEDAASKIRDFNRSTLHLAFAAHLDKVAAALRAVEWELSGDTGQGSARESIESCVSPGAEAQEFTRQALALSDQLNGWAAQQGTKS